MMMMMTMKIAALFLTFASTTTQAWVTPTTSAQRTLRRGVTTTTSLQAQVGIFYGTSTGSTMEAADALYQAFGEDVAAEPVDIETLEPGTVASALQAHDALVVGTPTWNTGADTERSGTGWDELYYTQMPAMQSVLAQKPVAVFGLGDQVSYAENYADAAGELFDGTYLRRVEKRWGAEIGSPSNVHLNLVVFLPGLQLM